MMPMIRWVGLMLAVSMTPIAMAAGPAVVGSAVVGSAEAGATKAAVCMACHGPNGNSVNEQWPSLAGQNAAYIEGQLKHFHDQSRINPIMWGLAAALSPQDIEDLAVYFSQQTSTGLEADPSYWQAGEKLYRGGDRTRNIPACMACHGPVGRGNPAAGYPMLRAQHSVYTIAQLTNYAADQRYTHTDKGDSSGGPNAAIMHTIASRLTAEDMRNVASYVQGMR
jgi:cytochrome c553